jgi:hypothetical protein
MNTNAIAFIQRFCALPALALLLVMLAGCSFFPPPAEPRAIAVVTSPHANSAQPLTDDVVAVLRDGFTSLSQVAVVESDGVPSVLYNETLPDQGELSVTAWQDGIATLSARLRTAAGTLATDPDTSPLEGITMAVRLLDPALSREIHYFGSGLQTTGSMPMTEGRLYLDPADVAEHLDETGQLPQLDGVTVHLHGLGSVAGDQLALDLPAIATLETFWVTVLERAGATVVLHPSPLTASPAPGLPPVALVALREAAPLAAVPFGCDRTELNDATLSFLHGSAEYVDPASAEAALAKIGSLLGTCPGPYTVLAGTSSTGTEELRRLVATQRAERVAQDLARASGIELSAFTTIAAATAHCGFTPDRDSEGRLILDIAASNRMVVVYAAGGPDTDCQ